MTKEQLAKLGIAIEEDSIAEEEAQKLIEAKFASLNAESRKNKDLLSARNSEIAEFKRKEQEKLSDDEKKALHYQEMEKEIETLKRKDNLNTLVSDLMTLGYDKELATKYANAQLDGKSTIEFQKQFMESKIEATKQEILKSGKKPAVNDPNGGVKTKEDFEKLGYDERLKLYNENPEIYKQFAKN